MKITVTTTDVPPRKVVLADDTARDRRTSNFRMTPDHLMDVQQFLRADAVDVVERGNKSTTITFDTREEYDSVIDAETGVMDLDLDTPLEGRVDFQAISNTGRRARWFTSAVVQITGIAYAGCSVEISYRITGGELKR